MHLHPRLMGRKEEAVPAPVRKEEEVMHTLMPVLERKKKPAVPRVMVTTR